MRFGGGSRTDHRRPRGDPRLSGLDVKIAEHRRAAGSVQQMRNVLMCTHKGIEDFTFRTQEDWAEQINTFVHNARLSGGIIAGISLLVGGIGIMNIMLASISERVREIGIRKSVGAATGDIFTQILVESVVIAILGGLAGLATSFGLVQLISWFSPTDNAPIINVTALGAGLRLQRAGRRPGRAVPGVQSRPAQPHPGPAVRVGPRMTLLNTILVGLKEVWSHKFRSLLTMLGIILGVASLVGMAAIIKGMENGMKRDHDRHGRRRQGDCTRTGCARRAGTPGRPGAGRTMADVQALRGCAPLCALSRPRWMWTT